MNKLLIFQILFLSFFPAKVLSSENYIDKKYGAYFNDNYLFWMLETKKLLAPSKENMSIYMQHAKNWNNNGYWINKAKKTNKLLCNSYLINSKKDKNYKKIYEERCLDQKYFNSQISNNLLIEKISSCDTFRKIDFFNEAQQLSTSKKDLIFFECGKIYTNYKVDRSSYFGTLTPFYKMFYIHGLSKNEIDNEIKNFHEKNKKCFISNKFNQVDVVKKGFIPKKYNKCMGWKWN